MIKKNGPGSSEPRTVPIMNLFLQCMYQSTDTFYKDEGGRCAHIQLDIAIMAERGITPSGINVSDIPITMTLLYENGLKVAAQDILHTVPHPGMHIDTDHEGLATIRFRIEEVSKNHRGQKFVIALKADTSRIRDLPAICETASAPILVLSKRKGTKRGTAAVPQAGMYAMTYLPQAAMPQAMPHATPQVPMPQAAMPQVPVPHAAMPQVPVPQMPQAPVPPALGPLGERAYGLLEECEWLVVGHAIDPRTRLADPSEVIVKCPECNSMCMGARRVHYQDCRLRHLLDGWR